MTKVSFLKILKKRFAKNAKKAQILLLTPLTKPIMKQNYLIIIDFKLTILEFLLLVTTSTLTEI